MLHALLFVLSAWCPAFAHDARDVELERRSVEMEQGAKDLKVLALFRSDAALDLPRVLQFRRYLTPERARVLDAIAQDPVLAQDDVLMRRSTDFAWLSEHATRVEILNQQLTELREWDHQRERILPWLGGMRDFLSEQLHGDLRPEHEEQILQLQREILERAVRISLKQEVPPGPASDLARIAVHRVQIESERNIRLLAWKGWASDQLMFRSSVGGAVSGGVLTAASALSYFFSHGGSGDLVAPLLVMTPLGVVAGGLVGMLGSDLVRAITPLAVQRRLSSAWIERSAEKKLAKLRALWAAAHQATCAGLLESASPAFSHGELLRTLQ